MKLTLKVTVLLLAFLVSAAFAHADIMPVGDPILGESWTQDWSVIVSGGLDHLQALLEPGVVDTPGASNFNVSGWTETFNNGTLWAADGPGTTTIHFDFHYTSDMSVPFTFHIQAYNGSEFQFNDSWAWSGSGWSLQPDGWTQDTPIPEPATMLMLGGLGAGLASARKLRRKK